MVAYKWKKTVFFGAGMDFIYRKTAHI